MLRKCVRTVEYEIVSSSAISRALYRRAMNGSMSHSRGVNDSASRLSKRSAVQSAARATSNSRAMNRWGGVRRVSTPATPRLRACWARAGSPTSSSMTTGTPGKRTLATRNVVRTLTVRSKCATSTSSPSTDGNAYTSWVSKRTRMRASVRKAAHNGERGMRLGTSKPTPSDSNRVTPPALSPRGRRSVFFGCPTLIQFPVIFSFIYFG